MFEQATKSWMMNSIAGFCAVMQRLVGFCIQQKYRRIILTQVIYRRSIFKGMSQIRTGKIRL